MKLNLAMLCGVVALADDAVSPAFTFDARYQPSGVTPDAWVAYEAEGLSSRFSAATVERAADENGNGIPDSWEATYGLVGANAAADADPDGDERTNLEEYNAGTNPIAVDDWMRGIAWFATEWCQMKAPDIYLGEEKLGLVRVESVRGKGISQG